MIEEAYVVPDTNVLLHFQPPDQIDWPALCGARRVLLVVYPLLRKELSRAKDLHANKRIRKRAGEREAWLRERLSNMDEPIRPGVFLFRDAREPRALVERLGLDRDVADDLIAAHAVNLRDGGRQVFVATADGGLEMKLEDQGIPDIVPDDALRLPPEPDPEKARADGLERELRALRGRLPRLEVLLAEPWVIRRQQGYGSEDDHVRLGLDAAEAVYRGQQVERAGWRHPGLVEKLRLDTIWNPKFQVHLAAAQRFLREQHRWVAASEGATPLWLMVFNSGTLTATDVRVRVFAPRHIALYRPGGFGTQPVRHSHLEAFSGVPVERDREDLAPYRVIGNGPGTPDVNHRRDIAEFSWPRVQQDASVHGIPPLDYRRGRRAVRARGASAGDPMRGDRRGAAGSPECRDRRSGGPGMSIARLLADRDPALRESFRVPTRTLRGCLKLARGLAVEAGRDGTDMDSPHDPAPTCLQP